MDIHINIKESLDSLFHIHMFILCIKNHILPVCIICFDSFDQHIPIVYLVR